MSDSSPKFVLVRLEQMVHGTNIKLIPTSWLRSDRIACLYPYEDDPIKIHEWVKNEIQPQVTWASFRVEELGVFSEYDEGYVVMRARQYGSRDDSRPSTSYLKTKLYDVTFMEVKTNAMDVPNGRSFDIEYKLLFKVNDEGSSDGSTVYQTACASTDGETRKLSLPFTNVEEFEKTDSEMFEDPQMRETMELIFQMVTTGVDYYDTALKLLLDSMLTPEVQAQFVGGPVDIENKGVRYFGNTITSDLIEDFVMSKYEVPNDNYELTNILDEILTLARINVNQRYESDLE